jgi:hypothetical protein
VSNRPLPAHVLRQASQQIGKRPPKPGKKPRGRPTKLYAFRFGKRGGTILRADGTTISSFIATREETQEICGILNEIGNDWDAVRSVLIKRGVINRNT